MNDSDPTGEPISDRVIEQRVRNRIIEYFELVGSTATQREYEASAPDFVNVPFEIIEQWEDWVRPEMWNAISDVYSPEERKALRVYHAVWDEAVRAMSDAFPPLADVQRLPEWERLTQAAASASEVFAERGKLAEDKAV